LLVSLEPVFVRVDALENGLGSFLVIPKVGIGGVLFFFFDLRFAVIYVKDTSSKPAGGFSNHYIDLASLRITLYVFF